MKHWALFPLFGVFLFIASPALADPPGTNAPTPTDEYWKEIGISSDVLKLFVQNKSCHSRKEEFIACSYAINSVFEERYLPYRLVTDDLFQSDPGFEEVVHDLDRVKIVIEKFYHDRKFMDRFKKRKIDQKKEYDSWIQLFKAVRTDLIDFEGILGKVLEEHISEEEESPSIAAGINGYYEAAYDPHTYIIPKKYFDEGQLPDAFFSLSNKRTDAEAEKVSFEMITDRNIKMGYIKLPGFDALDHAPNSSTCTQVKEAMFYLNDDGGLIFDVRRNPGGLLGEAECIASLFLPAHQLIHTVKSLSGSFTYRKGYSDAGFKYLKPVVILINGASASASELFSSALQDHERAVVIGERSYGKGSVQRVTDWLHSDKVYYAETFARFFRPSGLTTQIQGVTPDITVYLSPNPSEEDKFAIREEDRYINALPSLGGEWAQPRPGYISQLQRCIDEEGLAKERFRYPEDYQLLVAQDVLRCILKTE